MIFELFNKLKEEIYNQHYFCETIIIIEGQCPSKCPSNDIEKIIKSIKENPSITKEDCLKLLEKALRQQEELLKTQNS